MSRPKPPRRAKFRPLQVITEWLKTPENWVLCGIAIVVAVVTWADRCEFVGDLCGPENDNPVYWFLYISVCIGLVAAPGVQDRNR